MSGGWKLVPVEPDSEALVRGRDALVTAQTRGDIYVADTIRAIYMAMLAASPSPPPDDRLKHAASAIVGRHGAWLLDDEKDEFTAAIASALSSAVAAEREANAQDFQGRHDEHKPERAPSGAATDRAQQRWVGYREALREVVEVIRARSGGGA